MNTHLLAHRLVSATVLSAPLAFAAPAYADAVSAKATTPVAIAPAATEAGGDLKKTQEHLSLENSVADLQLKKDLAALSAEKQRRDLEAQIYAQKLQAELASRQAEIERMNKQTEVLNKSLALKEAERKTRLEEELAATREKLEKVKAQNDLAAAELAVKQRAIALNEADIKLKTTELELREKRDAVATRVLSDVHYTKDPYQNGELTISDRRIPLNGVISMATADRITERINYFNNLNHEYPIFIVIDESPGGSVAAGYKILRTMKGSQAPVYVVVKSFAASMAAGITTMATRSFAYPNAIILHHQLLAGSFGNLTEQKERVKEMEEWWKRLAEPVAQKMGVSLDELIKRMYQHRSTGDWQEFGDAAKKLRWVDEVVNVIHEESYVKNPDTSRPPTPTIVPLRAQGEDGMVQEVDPQGRAFVKLPRLSPVDAYYLYNPDNYYRLGL